MLFEITASVERDGEQRNLPIFMLEAPNALTARQTARIIAGSGSAVAVIAKRSVEGPDDLTLALSQLKTHPVSRGL